jgi:hypothetical protein
MLYTDGAFKLAHVEGPNGLTCLPILANARAHQVRLKEAPLSRKCKGRCQVRNAIAENALTSGRRLKQWTLWPEQEVYEAIRPLVLFHEIVGERAKEIDAPRRTLARKADEFEKLGMQSLFPSGEQGGAREISKTLPPEIHQRDTWTCIQLFLPECGATG